MPDDSATTPAGGLTSEQAEAWFAYMRVTLRLDYELNRELHQSTGLSHSDFHVLNALADSPGGRLQTTDLATRIGWERSRVSHHVARMETRGLVRRETSPADARATDVVLAHGGRTALRQATPSHAELVRSLVFDGLDAALLDPLRTALEQIHAHIVEQGSLPPPPGHQTDWSPA